MVLEKVLGQLRTSRSKIEKATQLLVSLSGYELSDELREETEINGRRLESLFAGFGSTEHEAIGMTAEDDEDFTALHLLKEGVKRIPL